MSVQSEVEHAFGGREDEDLAVAHAAGAGNLDEFRVESLGLREVGAGIAPRERRVRAKEILSVLRSYRTVRRGEYYVVRPMLPELHGEPLGEPALTGEYSSSRTTMTGDALRQVLQNISYWLCALKKDRASEGKVSNYAISVAITNTIRMQSQTIPNPCQNQAQTRTPQKYSWS